MTGSLGTDRTNLPLYRPRVESTDFPEAWTTRGRRRTHHPDPARSRAEPQAPRHRAAALRAKKRLRRRSDSVKSTRPNVCTGQRLVQNRRASSLPERYRPGDGRGGDQARRVPALGAGRWSARRGDPARIRRRSDHVSVVQPLSPDDVAPCRRRPGGPPPSARQDTEAGDGTPYPTPHPTPYPTPHPTLHPTPHRTPYPRNASPLGGVHPASAAGGSACAESGMPGGRRASRTAAVRAPGHARTLIRPCRRRPRSRRWSACRGAARGSARAAGPPRSGRRTRR